MLFGMAGPHFRAQPELKNTEKLPHTVDGSEIRLTTWDG